MKLNYLISLMLIALLPLIVSSNETKTETHIIGHVVSEGEHLPYATILIEGTTIGTATDETGQFKIFNIDPGTYILKAQAVGYKTLTKTIEVKLKSTIEVQFELEEDLIGIEQVVISANRNEQNRNDAMTVVNAITPKLFESTQTVSFGDALNYTPGLRVENNCQNCGFTQVRMNGMEGPYSQILINNRPIFSGLAGVYGLELYPSNMVERIEVVRGGGSALYGSNAIAGTINLITKDPIKSGFEVNTSGSIIGVGADGSGDYAFDRNISFNGSVIDNDAKAGVTVFGFNRDRDAFDANNDSYSELSLIKNTTAGARAFHRTGKRGKITVDYFNIRENRRGGNKFDYMVHDADIAEAVDHNINTGAISFDQLMGTNKLSVFGSVQHVDRATYYGAKGEENGAPDMTAYGQTYDLSYSVGTQYYLNPERLFFAPGNLVMGIENNGGYLEDTKLGYFDYETNEAVVNRTIADQSIITTGAFAQAEWEFNKLKASIGARLDHYTVSDKEHAADDVTNTVFSPRLSIKYKLNDDVQVRLSYSEGYRAPQIFDEDLHIEVSGSRKVLHTNATNLKQEESQSIMGSIDIDKPLGYMQNQWLIEGFYTKLTNPFAHEMGTPDEDGTVIYTRINATEGAYVAGANFEWNLAPSPEFMMRSGFTYQISKYETPQEDFNEKEFYRTPNTYGFLVLDYDFIENLCLSMSGNYTGSMLVPFYGINLPDPDAGELRSSDSFVDVGVKIAYDIKLNGTTLQLSSGVKNMFNSYQSDFDSGIDRDPGYMYGPGLPRTIYFGIKFSNFN